MTVIKKETREGLWDGARDYDVSTSATANLRIQHMENGSREVALPLLQAKRKQ